MTVLPDDQAYRRLRHGVVAVPAARDAVLMEGPDARSYLQGQCSQDVEALADGGSADALLLTPQGRLQSLVRVTRLDGDRFVLDVDAGFGPAVVARLLQFRLRVKVDVSALPWRCVALRGPDAAAVVAGTPLSAGVAVVAPFAWGGLVGVDLLGPSPTVAGDVPEAGAAVWEAARIEAGVPRMGAELDERTIAAEADLGARAVSFTKGCYTGQELVARLDARGNRVARHLRGLVAEEGTAGPSPEVGWTVLVGDRVVGSLTSVAHSPGLGRPVALAYVHRDVVPPTAVILRPPEGTAPADGDIVAAEVRTLPLVEAVGGPGAVTGPGGPAGSGVAPDDGSVG